MTKFALIKNGNTVIEIREYDTQPQDLPNKGFSWLPYVEIFPAFNPQTQILDFTTTIEVTQVVKTGTVRNLTAQELDTLHQLQVDDLSKAIFEALYNHENRIRALEGLGTITKQQLLTALKALL